METIVSHSGIIESITDKSIFVKIISQSACSACHAKNLCSVSEMTDKIIEVSNKNKNYKIGDIVKVGLTKSEGDRAVIYSYLLPFVVLILTLLIASVFFNELYSGLITLSALGLYYLVLFLFKKQIGKRFKFRIE